MKCSMIAVVGGMLAWRLAWLLCGAGARHNTNLYLVFGVAIAGGCSGIIMFIRDDVYSIRSCQHG